MNVITKPHAGRNTVSRNFKNPSAVNLRAIADALGCTVKDLLEPPKVLQQKKHFPSLEELFQKNDISPFLMKECVRIVGELLQKNKTSITTAQYLTCIKEVYLHSLSW